MLGTKSLARNDAPVVCLDCTSTLSQHPLTYGWGVILGDEDDIYIRLHRLPDRFSLAALPTSYPECALSNVGNLPANDVNLIFNIYYSEGYVSAT